MLRVAGAFILLKLHDKIKTVEKDFIEICKLCLLSLESGDTIFLEVTMKKILIIDDETQICEMMADLFESRDFEVTVAHSGNQGAIAFKDNDFDLAISDVRMPDGDGFDFAKQVEEIDPNFKKIIFVTGYLDIETTPIPVNVSKFFKKPVRFKELVAYVDELLGEN